MSGCGIMIRAGGPLFLVTAKHRCASCQQEAEVIALAACELRDIQGPADFAGCLLTDIERMPPEIRTELNRSQPRRGLIDSDAFPTPRYANRCTCGAWLEDADLHHPPGGTFSPLRPQDAQDMTLRTLPFTGCFEFICKPIWVTWLFTLAWASELSPTGKPRSRRP